MWVVGGGPSRLESARLRRRGDVMGALRVLLTDYGLACLILDTILRDPPAGERWAGYVQTARRLSAGRQEFRYWKGLK